MGMDHLGPASLTFEHREIVYVCYCTCHPNLVESMMPNPIVEEERKKLEGALDPTRN